MNGINKIMALSLITLLLVLISSLESHAAASSPDSLVYSFHFRQGDDLLMKDYRGNKRNFEAMEQWMTAENIARISNIKIGGTASPEGVLEFNNLLSLKRAEALRRYILYRWKSINKQTVIASQHTDYLSAWVLATQNDPSVPHREKVLEILNSNASIQTKWANIQLLTGGASQYIRKSVFPQLRNAVACVITFKESNPPTEKVVQHEVSSAAIGERAIEKVVAQNETIKITTDHAVVEKVATVVAIEEKTKNSRPTTDTKEVVEDKNLTLSKEPKGAKCAIDYRFAIKTNLLQGAVAFAPNLGFEYALNNKSTIELTAALNHWGLNGSSTNNKKLAHWIIQSEYRYWLSKSFCGHFFGAHALGGKYNISGHNLPNLFLGGKLMESQYRYDGWMVGAGVSYGYHLRLAPHWGVEFNVGIGVAHLRYDKYDCVRCGRKLNTETKTYFGPTKAGISLIYNF